MNHDYRKHLANSARVAVALCALAALGGRAAQAQTATQITTPAQLGAFTFTTPNYPGKGQGQIPSPFPTSAGPGPTPASNTSIVLTDRNDAKIPNGNVFTRQNITTNSSGQNNTGLDFPIGTTLLQTADAANNDLGPLQIDFTAPGGVSGVGVSGFGVQVQNFGFNQELFTLQVFTNGSTVASAMNTFTFAGDNSNSGNNGQSVFVGALATPGNTITRAVITGESFDSSGDDAFNNNFFFAPVTITNVPAVPEASTVVGFGMGVILFAGMAVGARRRKVSRAPQSA